MKKFLILFLIALPLAAQENNGWFVGIEAGQADVDEADDEVGMAGLFGGYQFNRYFAIEAGYMSVSTLDLDFNFSDQIRAESDVQGFRAMAVGILPLGDRVSANGKAGFFIGETEEVVIGNDGNLSVTDDTDGGAAFEVGLRFKLTSRLNLDLNYGDYTISSFEFDFDDDNDIITIDLDDRSFTAVKLGLSYRF